MNIPNPNPLPADPAPKSKLRKCACLLLVLFLLAGSAFLAIWYLGSQSPHASSGHPLHSAFDSSPAHSKLLGQLAKGRLSVVVGAREEGLLEFGEHLANVLSQKGPVFFENYSPEHFELFQIVREAKTAINQLLKIELTLAADWVLLSAQGDPIPTDVLQKIQARNPKAKVVIFTTKPQKVSLSPRRSRDTRSSPTPPSRPTSSAPPSSRNFSSPPLPPPSSPTTSRPQRRPTSASAPPPSTLRIS